MQRSAGTAQINDHADMSKSILLAVALLTLGSARGQTPAHFFQFTSAVPNCPQPAWSADKTGVEASDAVIADALKAALTKGQLYTHSPLVNSSLWASVQSRIVTIQGCVAGDAYTRFDHASLVTQIENVGNSIPDVRKTVVLIRTSAQAAAGLPVPYQVNELSALSPR